MLSERLKELIDTLGIKKGDFAEKINFSQGYISMILTGTKQSPSARFYESIKREFNVNIDWLKNGDGEMFTIKHKDLTPFELDLIEKYNTLPLSERKIVEEVINAMIYKNMYENEKEK